MVAFITELNTAMYKEFTSTGLVLVDILAKWCAPCKVISPIVDEISSDFQGNLKVGKLDADENKDILVELSVRNIPTLVLYKDGVVVEKHIGMITKQKLKDLIDQYI